MPRAFENSFTKRPSTWGLLLEACFRWLLGSRGGGGQEAKRVPSHVPISSSFERCWSHWPCRSSLSQGQYSPSTAGGARHPQTAPRIPQGHREKGGGGKENREQSYPAACKCVYPAACKCVLSLVHTGIQVCGPKMRCRMGTKECQGLAECAANFPAWQVESS